ncbi:hypothetical protein JCM3775_006894 [Rhodotorula graminis]|uniref:Uncharacterized protein n=1 Tax=Rhodotorula graminis (strain WP1) TaxID=578459 RepID=A0A194SE68_RHOGW|nr:uncharacterized protein RHOBADRAFT_41769 [Rhodotorula graminis WP1]KPV77771.1 hypothetical protein RHOBADRAFT_41769 [Rhodotorula graminis WP1]
MTAAPSSSTSRSRSSSRQGRPRALSPVNSYPDFSLPGDISAASSSAADSVSSWALSSSSRSSSPASDLDTDLDSPPSRKPSLVPLGAQVAQVVTAPESDAIAAIRARRASLSTGEPAQPSFYLPALLSRLPLPALDPSSARVEPGPSPALFDSTRALSPSSDYPPGSSADATGASTVYTASHLPTLDLVSHALHHALHAFRPITRRYATSPYATSFNWADLRLEDDATGRVKREAREWYIVAFRSRRNDGLPEDRARRLYEADRAAHEEAVTRGGLILYWYGNPVPAPSASTASHGFDPDDVGRNLATCVWQSRADAIAAMRGEHHKEAARLASTTYEYYTLERYVLRKEPGELSVRIRPWHGREVEGAVEAA